MDENDMEKTTTESDDSDNEPLAKLVQRSTKNQVTTAGSQSVQQEQPTENMAEFNSKPKALTAFSHFFNDTQQSIRNKNATATFEDVSRIVSSMWESLDANTKLMYQRKEEEERQKLEATLSHTIPDLLNQEIIKQRSETKMEVDETEAPEAEADKPNDIPSFSNTSQANNQKSEPPIMPGETSTDNEPQVTPMDTLTEQTTVSASTTSAATSNPGASPTTSLLPGTSLLKPTAAATSTNTPRFVIKQALIGGQQTTALLNPDGKVFKVLSHSKPRSASQSPMTNTTTTTSATITNPSDTATTTTTTKSDGVPPAAVEATQSKTEDTQTKPVKLLTGSTIDVDAPQQPVRICTNSTCDKPAVRNKKWSEDFCSSACIVAHCKEAFAAWVSARVPG